MEKLLVNGEIISLLEIDKTFASLETSARSESYLRKLSEKVLFERYREALKVNHFLPFDEFPKPLEQMYFRMRLNLVNSEPSISQKLDPFLEEIKKLRDHVNTEMAKAVIERQLLSERVTELDKNLKYSI